MRKRSLSESLLLVVLLVLQAHVFLGFAGRYTVYYSVYYSVYLQQQRQKKKALVKQKKAHVFLGFAGRYSVYYSVYLLY